jgi:hypothetical protein
MGAICDIDCLGANSCDATQCTSGASCIIHCGGGANCDFDVCAGGSTNCPGGEVTCNMPCP